MSGVTDHFARDEKHALALVRRTVANLNTGLVPTDAHSDYEEPAFSSEDQHTPADLLIAPACLAYSLHIT